MRKTVGERFWEKVNKKGIYECWLWKGQVGTKGYGKININGETIETHRVAYSLFLGNILKGFCVCHTCDCPLCVNPNHLFLGTHTDNMRDAANKGRLKKGNQQRQSKLTDNKVKEIRRLYSECNITQALLASNYGVSQSVIGRIIKRVDWSHVP